MEFNYGHERQWWRKCGMWSDDVGSESELKAEHGTLGRYFTDPCQAKLFLGATD